MCNENSVVFLSRNADRTGSNESATRQLKMGIIKLEPFIGVIPMTLITLDENLVKGDYYSGCG